MEAKEVPLGSLPWASINFPPAPRIKVDASSRERGIFGTLHFTKYLSKASCLVLTIPIFDHIVGDMRPPKGAVNGFFYGLKIFMGEWI